MTRHVRPPTSDVVPLKSDVTPPTSDVTASTSDVAALPCGVRRRMEVTLPPVRLPPALLGVCAWLVACAPSARPCPAVTPAAIPAPPTHAVARPAAPAPPDADVVLLLHPSLTPSPLVNVEVTLAHAEGAAAPWRIALGTADRIARPFARDANGDIEVAVANAPPGVELRLARAPAGPVTLAYSVLAGGEAPDDPTGVTVLEDRFRGAGERLLALPAGVEDTRSAVLVRIDGEALRAASAASSLGIGTARRAALPPRALRYATFVAGSLGVQVIDDPGAGHDEGAWLGYTDFDPRPAIAELAQFRTSLRELLKSQDDPGAWTYLVVSQTRPMGWFRTTPRMGSVLLQVGPSEPWTASLQLSLAQQLARRWIGGELHVETSAGHEGEGLWFSEGVSRYVAMRLLSRLGMLAPDDARNAVAGELSVLATSPDRTLPNARLGELAPKDEVARATLMARGAVYALREAAVMRAHTKGERGLDSVLALLVRQAEDHKQGAFAVPAWLEAIGKADPNAARIFDAYVVRGDPIALPADALGPCFRPGTGEYVAFDPGFDLEATRESRDGKVVGVRPDGPAAKAGLKDGDVIESMQAREADGEAPVKLTLTREGSQVSLTYVPRGARGRGQTWTRIPGVPNDRCGQVP